MIYQISPATLELIKRFEGFSSTPYLCPAGKLTIGYGQVITNENMFVTQDEASLMLLDECLEIANKLTNLVKPTLNENQLGAIISFCYNLGINAFANSTLLKMINNDPSDANIPAEFMKWVHCKGAVLQGLVNRRQAEADLYESPST
jgi:lysozyme